MSAREFKPNGTVTFETYSTFGTGRFISTRTMPARVTAKTIATDRNRYVWRLKERRNALPYWKSNASGLSSYEFVMLSYSVGEATTLLRAPYQPAPASPTTE